MCAHSLLSRVLFSNIRLWESKPKQGHYAKESVEVTKGQPCSQGLPSSHPWSEVGIGEEQQGRTETVNSHFILTILLITQVPNDQYHHSHGSSGDKFHGNTRELEVLQI